MTTLTYNIVNEKTCCPHFGLAHNDPYNFPLYLICRKLYHISPLHKKSISRRVAAGVKKENAIRWNHRWTALSTRHHHDDDASLHSIHIHIWVITSEAWRGCNNIYCGGWLIATTCLRKIFGVYIMGCVYVPIYVEIVVRLYLLQNVFLYYT